jgi:hypothetical protein
LIESHEANIHIGIKKLVKTINNKLIPSIPNKKYELDPITFSVEIYGNPFPPDQFI